MAATPDITNIIDELTRKNGAGRPVPVHVGVALAEYAKTPGRASDIMDTMHAMISGVRKYQNHPWKRTIKLLEQVWHAGQARLFYAPAAGRAKAAVLLVPSMINRSRILDLTEERSFTRWLAGQGFEVYLLDWGEPCADATMKNLEGILHNRLTPAIDFVKDRSKNKPVFALGYCMGGTLLAGVLKDCNEKLDGVVFLAAPWDFHAGDQTMVTEVRKGAPLALQSMTTGKLGMNWVQSVFATISAERTVKKFADFFVQEDENAMAQFMAVEDWLNDGMDLPAELGQVCIVDWYDKNQTGFDLSGVKTPALIVASSKDKLVPAESSLALARDLSHADILRPDMGHIGMITGKRARDDVWEKISKWLLSKT